MEHRRLEVFLAALQLGLTSFGGPFAHLGAFHREYVVRRRWLDEAAYADLLALCQFLPGPTSSQLGMVIGRHRAGVSGAFLAWLGFTLPSAVVMVVLAALWTSLGTGLGGLVTGLEAAAFAVVAVAAWSLALRLSSGWARGVLTVLAAGASGLFPGPWSQPLVLGVAGGVGLVLFRNSEPRGTVIPRTSLDAPPWTGWPWLAGFASLLVLLPLVDAWWDLPLVSLADAFYRAGALVFGGGHVVLPLLRPELVPSFLPAGTFLAGYGFAQTVPGPLFTVAGFWGWAAGGPAGAVTALVFLFLPAFLLVMGFLPLWTALQAHPRVRPALTGVNAAVVGILAWALVDPLGTSVFRSLGAGVLALVLVVLHGGARAPAWGVVAAGAVGGVALAAAGLTPP